MDVRRTNDDQFSMCAILYLSGSIYLSLEPILLHTQRNMCAQFYRAEAPFCLRLLQKISECLQKNALQYLPAIQITI